MCMRTHVMLFSESTNLCKEFMWKQGSHLLFIVIRYIHNVYTSVHLLRRGCMHRVYIRPFYFNVAL